MKKILVFTRPFTSEFTKYYEKHNKFEIDYISDFKYHVKLDVMSFIYDNFQYGSEEEQYDELNYSEIIMRDRYLRYLQLNISKKLVNLSWEYINIIFTQSNYSGYIGMPVDNYIQHLLVKACFKFNVKAISPVHSPLPHRARITNLGEYIKVRDSKDEEINEIYELLSNKKFRPIWLSKNRTNSKIMKLYIKERAKKIIFKLLKFKNSDPYSFHYNCIYPMKGAITIHSLDVLKVRNLFTDDLDVIKEKSKKYEHIAYFALQFNPEASINYLIPDNKFSQYDLMIERIINNLPNNTLLLVKEHPDIYGYRRFDFYKKFLDKENIMLLDVNIQTSVVFELADYILVSGSASTGIEGVIKDKTIISFGGAFYGKGNDYIHQVKSFEDIYNLEKYFIPITLNKENKLKFIKTILDNTINLNYEGLVRSTNKNYDANMDATKKILDYMEKIICVE